MSFRKFILVRSLTRGKQTSYSLCRFSFFFFLISPEDPRVFLLRMSVHISAHFLSFPYKRDRDTRPPALGGTFVGKGPIVFIRKGLFQGFTGRKIKNYIFSFRIIYPIHVIKLLLEVKNGWATPRLVSFKGFIPNFRRASPPLSYKSPPRDFGLPPPQSSLFWVCPARFLFLSPQPPYSTKRPLTFEAVKFKGCFDGLLTDQ